MWNTRIQLFIEEYLDERPDGSAAFYKLRETFPAHVVEKLKKADLERDIEERIKHRTTQLSTAFGRRIDWLYRERLKFKSELLEAAFNYVEELCKTDPGESPADIVRASEDIDLVQRTVQHLDVERVREERVAISTLVGRLCAFSERFEFLYPEVAK